MVISEKKKKNSILSFLTMISHLIMYPSFPTFYKLILSTFFSEEYLKILIKILDNLLCYVEFFSKYLFTILYKFSDTLHPLRMF